MFYSVFFISNSFLCKIGPSKLGAGLFLGCEDVNEFVDKAVEEALKKEKEEKGG